MRSDEVEPEKASLESLLDRGRTYAESLFEEDARVDATALVETKDEIYIVTMPLVEATDDEDVRDAFRKAIEEVCEKHRPESVTVVTEVWFQVLPHLTEETRPPMRLLRREGVLVSVETRKDKAASFCEVTRWGESGSMGDWSGAPSMLMTGLTGFFDPPDEFVN